MAEKVLGLIGPGEGSKVWVRHLGSHLRARVTGLKDGAVEVLCGSDQKHEIRENGIHKLFVPSDGFVSVKYGGNSKVMICTLIGG